MPNFSAARSLGKFYPSLRALISAWKSGHLWPRSICVLMPFRACGYFVDLRG
jgi:hypothetical protein